MAIYIKGSNVPNATSYTLYRVTGSTYTQVGRPQSTINFNLTELRQSEGLNGEYTFVVQASAPDFETSNYSNRVTVNLTTGDVSGGGGGGGDTPVIYAFSINPTPSDATVTLVASGYQQQGNAIHTQANVDVTWVVSKQGYVTRSGTHTVTENYTLPVTLQQEVVTVTYTITYTHKDAAGNILKTSTETVNAGTNMTFATSDSRAQISGYVCNSVSPTNATVSSNITVTYEYTAEVATTATLTINPTPSDAKVSIYAKGYTQSGNSITVPNDGTVSPLYQVTKNNYLSKGGSVEELKSNQSLDISLQPFSSGNWTDITSTAEKVSDYFLAEASGRHSGPYSNWCYWILPATPGKTYRIIAAAGQVARLWGFYAERPTGDGTIKPISVSANNGITVNKVADEVVAPEGAVYLVVNNRIQTGDQVAIIEVLD